MPTDIYGELEWRGLNYQSTDAELGDKLRAEAVTLYCGFDPTAPSLTVGHLMQMLRLRRFQMAGHRPIVLAGGGTGLIGDPSFRATERPLLSKEAIEANLSGIKPQLERLLDFGEGLTQAVLFNNADWLTELKLTDFLRDIGKHFSVNAMISKDSVRQRLEEREQGITYTEFSYLLMQAYDFLHLFDKHGCKLQISGSDQWGNITAGVELIRKVRGETAYGLTTPLITLPDGRAMSKTGGGAVWLDPNLTSPYRFFQYWLNTEDSAVIQFLKFFTFLSQEEIEELSLAVAKSPKDRVAQKALAQQVTALVHGDSEMAKAEAASRALFAEEIVSLDEQTLNDVLEDIPSSTHRQVEIQDGLGLVDVLAETGLSSSKAEAREHLSGGGVYVNNTRVADGARAITTADLMAGKYVLVRRGKKTHHLLKFE